MKRKLMTCVEGIAVTTLMISLSAMDSEAFWIPAAGLILSAVVLLVTSKLEQKNSTASTDQS